MLFDAPNKNTPKRRGICEVLWRAEQDTRLGRVVVKGVHFWNDFPMKVGVVGLVEVNTVMAPYFWMVRQRRDSRPAVRERRGVTTSVMQAMHAAVMKRMSPPGAVNNNEFAPALL